jgi:hypothetical protein
MCTGVRRTVNENDHRTPSGHEIQKEWNVPTLPPYIFMTCTHT